MTDDRDKLKKRTPPSGVGLTRHPSFTIRDREDVTGQYEGYELQKKRAEYKPEDRISHLETKFDDLTGKHNELSNTVTETRVIVGEMKGQLMVLPELVQVVKDTADRAAQREHVTFTSQTTIDTAQRIDTIDSKKNRRERLTTIIGGVVTLLTSGALIHWLLSKF